MKKVTFLRHYKMEYPFDWWRNMTLQQYLNLGAGKTDPDINNDIEDYVTEHLNLKEFSSIEKIISSPSKRTINTAKYLNNNLKLDLQIETSDLFREITWKPIKQVTEEDFEGMKKVGKIEIKTARDLSPLELIDQVKSIFDFLQDQPEDQILVITHSFLIAVINYYSNNKDKISADLTIEQIKKYEVGGYLKGITINI